MNSLIKAIELCGGSQAAFAKRVSENLPDAAAETVTPQMVWNWINRDKIVPAGYCPTIEKICFGKVICEELNDKADWAYLRQSLGLASLPEQSPKQNRNHDTPELLRETEQGTREVLPLDGMTE